VTGARQVRGATCAEPARGVTGTVQVREMPGAERPREVVGAQRAGEMAAAQRAPGVTRAQRAGEVAGAQRAPGVTRAQHAGEVAAAHRAREVTGAQQAREVTGAEQVREMRRDLGRGLAARRREVGFSQRQLAPLTGYARSTLSDAELGRHHVRRDFWERCERVLGVDGELTSRYDQIEAVAAAWRAAEIRAVQAARMERAAAWPPDPSAGAENGAIPGAGWPAVPPAVGQNGATRAPASVVTVQHCPACRYPVAVITVLAAPPH
jgi:ribosome-binding protein aMBF1 (putative translation factor)